MVFSILPINYFVTGNWKLSTKINVIDEDAVNFNVQTSSVPPVIDDKTTLVTLIPSKTISGKPVIKYVEEYHDPPFIRPVTEDSECLPHKINEAPESLRPGPVNENKENSRQIVSLDNQVIDVTKNEQEGTSTKYVLDAGKSICNEFFRMTIGKKEKNDDLQLNTVEEKTCMETSEKESSAIIKNHTENELGEDGLCDALSLLKITGKSQSKINIEETKKWLSNQLDAKAVGAQATEWHRSLPLEGGHAHSLLACYRGALMDEAQAKDADGIPDEVIDLLGKFDDRRGKIVQLEFLQEYFLTKKRDKLRKKMPAKMFPKEGQERLFRYLRHGECSLGGVVEGPWYGARSFAHLPLWPTDDAKMNAADVCQGDIDDCYFACGLSLAAEHYPTCLKKRIVRIDDKENGKSRFEVRHWSERRGGCISPNPKSRRGPNITEVGDTFYSYRRVNCKGGPGTPLYCRSRSDVLYPMVFERAFQRYRSGGGQGSSYEEIVGKNCLEAEAVLHFLTGLKFKQIKLAEDGSLRVSRRSPVRQDHEDKIWELICSMLQKGRAISTGTYSMGSRRNEKPPEEWYDLCVVSDHNYALLDAGTDSVHGRFVVLRNPFGKQLSPFVLSSTPVWPESVMDGPEIRDDAVFRIGLPVFFSYFETLSYAAETCQWYPIKLCHRYRPFFADSENIKWCEKTVLHKDKEEDAMVPRRLEFE